MSNLLGVAEDKEVASLNDFFNDFLGAS